MTALALKAWAVGMGAKYGVNPVVYAVIYIGSSPLMWLSVLWLVNQLRRGHSVVLPAISCSVFFLAAYLYVLAVGRNVPAWVYLVTTVLLLIGGWSTLRTIRRKAGRNLNAA